MLDRAIEVLTGRRVVALTGAGISTDSGIPDYRGPGSVPRTPMTFDQFRSSETYRSRYWARNFVGFQFMETRTPNPGHLALARWEEAPLPLRGIVTQNVDTLHEKAGSIRVVDLHGRFDQVVCMEQGHQFTRSELQSMLRSANPGFSVTPDDVDIAPDADAVLGDTAGFVVPVCPHCGGTLRPNVVYFGELIPSARATAARELVDSADALLVAGSSLTVHSGLRFVTRAAQQGKPVVIINRGETRGDRYAQATVDAPLSSALPELVATLGK